VGNRSNYRKDCGKWKGRATDENTPVLTICQLIFIGKVFDYLEKINRGVIMQDTMENKPLHIPPQKSWKGLTVYCNKCKTNMKEICNETGKSLKNCPHPERHVFKVYSWIWGSKNSRKTKKLETRDVNEAIKQAVDFEREVKENNYTNPIPSVPSVNTAKNENINREEKNKNQSISLSNAMARYVGFLNNDPGIVPEFRKKQRSKKHLQNVEWMFRHFNICAKQNGYDITTLPIDQVDDQLIGKYHDYLLKERRFSNTSYNNSMTLFVGLYNYLNKNGYAVKNPFLSIPRRAVNNNVEIITDKEFKDLLELVEHPELGKQTLKTGEVKNLYKPWMSDAIEFGLYTGRRNEEMVMAKWQDVFEEDGKPAYIRMIDYKVSRRKGIEDDNPKFIYVPVTDELNNLLLRINYNKYKGMDNYILAPEETMTREGVNHFITHSFTHYYKQLNTGKDISFKNLRKTYITKLSKFMGVDNARLITKHSGTGVMEEHYLDKKFIALTARGFSMFGDKEQEQDRAEELKEIRNSKTEKGISLER